MNEKLTDLARTTRPELPEHERAAMRSEFIAHMEANPARSRNAVPSPFMRYMPAYAFALLLFVTTPVIYAAERSLPNEALYSLKVNVIEPVVVSTFSITKEGAADAKSALIERRFTEAQALVARNELGEEESEELAARISMHVEELQTYIETTESSGDLSEALDTGSDLELALEGYGHALESMSETDPSEENDVHVDSLVAAFEADSVEAGEASEDIEDALAASSEETEQYLATISKDAEEALDRAREELARTHDSALPLIEEAEALVDEAEDAYSAGESSRRSGVSGSALSEYRDAFQAAERSRILLRAAESLEEAE